MPIRTECPRCHRVGLVRFENVLKGARAERHYYCGGCTYAWVVASDGESTPKHDGDGYPPEPSRPRDDSES